MTDDLPNRARTGGIRLITLMLVVSFVFIPVRCDASAAPHSIFVAPVAMGSMAHSHHEMAHSGPAKTVAGKSMLAHTQHHDATASSSAKSMLAARSLRAPCSAMLSSGADPKSQQPVGAALDLPTAPVPPTSSALLARDGATVLSWPAQAVAPQGIALEPDAPPPKTV